MLLCFFRPQQTQLITSLNQVLGNKPNLTISVEGMKPLSDTKAQVVITVQEKGATGMYHYYFFGYHKTGLS